MKTVEYTEKVLFQGCEYTLEVHESPDGNKFWALASSDNTPHLWFLPSHREDDFLVFEKVKNSKGSGEYYTLNLDDKRMERVFPK